MPEIENIKYFALLERFELSDKLIKLGFGELQNINLNNDFYFLPFQFLSQGFERFKKAYICLGHFHKYPLNFKYLKNLGYDLEKLLKEIIKNYDDEFERNLDSEYKSRKIKKSEHKSDWSFYAEVVIIECRQNHWCIVTIDGFDYVLNGSAKGRYKLENPQNTGMEILGKSISDFIKMALELNETEKH